MRRTHSARGAAADVPFRPAKGQESDACSWMHCERCRRDGDAFGGCRLLLKAFGLIGMQIFPRAWVLTADGPRCSAFVPLGGRRSAPLAPAMPVAPQMELAL